MGSSGQEGQEAVAETFGQGEAVVGSGQEGQGAAGVCSAQVAVVLTSGQDGQEAVVETFRQGEAVVSSGQDGQEAAVVLSGQVMLGAGVLVGQTFSGAVSTLCSQFFP